MDRVLLTFIMISIYKPLLYNSPLYFLTRSRQLQLEQYRMQLYIGQIGWTQGIRNRGHTQAIRHNYDGHILKTEHCYGHLHDPLDTMQTEKSMQHYERVE